MLKSKNKAILTFEDAKLYSTKSITGATFLGGPLVAGYLISENFKAFNETNKAKTSLITGIVATIFLFTAILIIPEDIMSKIPNSVIPLFYTGIIWFFVEWTQGDRLNTHKENNNTFYSGWRAAGFGFLSLIIIVVGLFGYFLLELNNPAYRTYDDKIAEFSKNETESLKFYDRIDSKGRLTLLQELDENVIPLWEENISIANEITKIEGLSTDLKSSSESLIKYSELRLEVFQLTRKAIDEDTNKYDYKLYDLNNQIEAVLKDLTEL
ncbi:hypothetical protein DFQ05_0289 [Winogradskyella wandonensis]|uniref:Uncharacterized protein n=1 Tax=Winogradskyella wandonensis TaxID=1442586 RepID=A0A4R1KWN3_9FLAO|nr:hypothetical protein [Winogradskyella wandonensis]TCK68779.1 hypothetical protein DFQ05_0289 [Winogradskyella wandonensis]